MKPPKKEVVGIFFPPTKKGKKREWDMGRLKGKGKGKRSIIQLKSKGAPRAV